MCLGYRRKPSTSSWVGFNYAARATALSFAVADLPIFTWPWAPRRAIRASTSSSNPVRPHVKEHAQCGARKAPGQAGYFGSVFVGTLHACLSGMAEQKVPWFFLALLLVAIVLMALILRPV